jgi:molybdenum cofactor cytidylyltransferase
VLVLAAGYGRRFGSDKRLYALDGDRPMLRVTLENAIGSGSPCRVCVRDGDAGIAGLLRGLAVEVIACANSVEGMGATLAEGVGACDDWDGLLVALGDMPWVQAGTYANLLSALDSNTIVQPVCQGKTGHPVGFGRRFYSLLGALGGDEGGRQILREYSDQLRQVPVDDVGIHRDLDAPPSASPAVH